MSRKPARAAPLVVACAVDADVYPQLMRGRPTLDRSIADFDIITALRVFCRNVHLVPVGDDLEAVVTQLRTLGPTVVFNLAQSALEHEAPFAGVLELLGFPYTGSGLLGIALTRDKVRSRQVLNAAGISVPRFVELPPGSRTVSADLSPPFIVKPARLGGGSAGVYANSVVKTRKDAISRARKLWTHVGSSAVCDEFVIGREFRVGAMEERSGRFRLVGVTECLFPRASPGWGFKTHAIRMNPRVRDAHGVESVVPTLSRALVRELDEIADRSCRLLDVRNYATLDVRLDAEGRCFVIEVNANPGLSSRSLIWRNPSFLANIRRIVASAMAR